MVTFGLCFNLNVVSLGPERWVRLPEFSTIANRSSVSLFAVISVGGCDQICSD